MWLIVNLQKYFDVIYDFGLIKKVHVSIGITFKNDFDDVKSLFKRADDALYTAKENGRNQYYINH